MHGIISEDSQKQPKKIFILGCFLSIIPIWLVDYLPMIDLPEHAAQIATLARLLAGKEYYSSYYEITLLTPYWFAYILTALLSFIMPLTIVLKCIISLAVALTPWAAAKLRALVSQDDSMDWLFLPIGYGFAFEWGFLTFMLSIPLAFLSLRYFINYLFFPTTKKMWYCALYAFLLFLAHLLTYIFIISIVVMVELLITKDIVKSIKKILPFFSPVLFIFKWLIYVYNAWTFDIIFRGNVNDINYEEFLKSIGGHYAPVLGMIVTSLIFILPLFFGANYIFGWQALPFIITSLLVLFGPSTFFDNNFTSERFSIFLIPFFILFINFDKKSIYFYKIRCFICLFIAITLLCTIGKKIYSFNKEALLIHRILDKLEPRKKMFVFINGKLSVEFNPYIFTHIGGWYRAEKNGISDPSFARYPSLVVTYKKKNSRQLDWKSNLSYEDYRKGNYLQYYDYFLFVGDKNKVNSIIKATSIKANLIYKENNWWVFKKI